MGSVKEIRDQFSKLNAVNDVAIEQLADGSRVVVPATPATPVATAPIVSKAPTALSD